MQVCLKENFNNRKNKYYYSKNPYYYKRDFFN